MWLFPLGGQRGTSLEVEIRGQGLQAAYAVVAEEEGIRTEFRAVEEIVEESEEGAQEQKEKKEPEYRVRVGVEIDAAARPGNHWLRVVTPRGISDRVQFRVNADRVIRESADPMTNPAGPRRSTSRSWSMDRSTRLPRWTSTRSRSQGGRSSFLK